MFLQQQQPTQHNVKQICGNSCPPLRHKGLDSLLHCGQDGLIGQLEGLLYVLAHWLEDVINPIDLVRDILDNHIRHPGVPVSSRAEPYGEGLVAETPPLCDKGGVVSVLLPASLTVNYLFGP